MPTALGAADAASYEDSSTRFVTPAAENARALVRRFIKQSAILADGPSAGSTVDYFVGETRVSGSVLIGNTADDGVPVRLYVSADAGLTWDPWDGAGGGAGGGGLTDAELRASPVPVTGTVSVNEPVTVDGVQTDALTDAELRASAIEVHNYYWDATTSTWVPAQQSAGGGGVSGHTIKEDGVALATRTALNFGVGLVASDDSVNDETDVDVLFGTGAGTVAEGNHNHDTAYEPLGAVATHEAAADPHPGYATDADLSSHTGDTIDAHDASAISVVPAGGITSTDVQAALAELDTEKAAAADLTAHLNDTADAHDASAVSVVPAGNLASTDAQAALEELDAEKVAKATLTAKGDLFVATAAGTPARKAVGTDGKLLAADSADSTGVAWKAATVTIYEEHTWAISGTIAVPSGDTDFIIPKTVFVNSGETVLIDKVRHKINSGTSVTWDLKKNGVGATGFTALSSSTTGTTTNPADVSLADGDTIQPVVSAVSGTPKNWEVTVVIKRTIPVVLS